MDIPDFYFQSFAILYLIQMFMKIHILEASLTICDRPLPSVFAFTTM